MKLAQLLDTFPDAPIPDCDIKGLSNDSRTVQPGDLFFAYKGATSDGRLYINQALDKGASAVIFDPDAMLDLTCLNPLLCIPIPHLSQKIARLASRFYQYPTRTLSVTGVTGTNGKTTIAYQLAQAHQLLGQSSAYIGTIGQGLVDALQPLANTTPDALCLQKLLYNYQQHHVTQVCMEVSSHALSLGRVEEVHFTQAIYTNLTHDHLDFHKSMSEYALAKASLFAFPNLEFAIMNKDDKFYSLMSQSISKSCRQFTYSLKSDSDVHALKWHSSMQGSDIDASTPWGTLSFHVNMLGEFNIYNSLAVLTSLLATGYSVAQVLDVMPKLKASPGRMEMVSQTPCVIVDYAHTPDALENALKTLQQLKQGRLWVVFGCGGDRDKAKRPMMGHIASQYADVVMITSDNPRHEMPSVIIEEIKLGVLEDAETFSVVDRRAAIQQVLHLAEEKDIVLIAGKGHEQYQQMGDDRLFFSDQCVVRELLGNS